MKEDNVKVYIRKDKRFEIKYYYGSLEKGEAKYKSIYGKSKDDVIAKYKSIIKKYKENKDLLIYTKYYFGYYINIWLNDSKIKNKASTYSSYLYITNAYIIPFFADIKVRRISLIIINNFIIRLQNKGLKNKSIKDILMILKQILNYANINIKIPMPKTFKNDIQILTYEEQKKLEKRLLDNWDEITISIYLSLYTGLRIGELCALQWQNIDLQAGSIKIVKTIIRVKDLTSSPRKTIVVLNNPKTASSKREVPIPSFLIPFLKKLSQNKQPDFFLITSNKKIMEPRIYFSKYKKILKEIGLEKYNFHALRHTFATRCIEKGSDPKTLSEILGHSSVKITLERYVHPNYKDKSNLINKLQPFYSNNLKV